MSPADLPIAVASLAGGPPLAASFAHRHQHELVALASLLVALLAAGLVERAFARRGRALAQAIGRGELTPVADTRLRFVRRLATAAILVVGVGVALAQFGGLSRLAASVLASSAIAAAVLGFAARQTLANVVAGLMLAITQPLRIGDAVTVEDESGTVEDIRLTYTWLRTPTGTRVIIPNERLTTGVLRNDTIVDSGMSVEVSLWLAPGADVDVARERLERVDPGASVRVAEVAPEGIRLTVGGETVDATARAAREADLRARCLRELRAAGLQDHPR